METEKCIVCGAPIHGRPDKKYCCLKCKNAYGNGIRRRIRTMKERTISELSDNYDILTMLLKCGKRSISLNDISEMGFHPGTVSGHSKVKGGHDEYRCFDIRYCQTGTKIFRIRQEDQS